MSHFSEQSKLSISCKCFFDLSCNFFLPSLSIEDTNYLTATFTLLPCKLMISSSLLTLSLQLGALFLFSLLDILTLNSLLWFNSYFVDSIYFFAFFCLSHLFYLLIFLMYPLLLLLSPDYQGSSQKCYQHCKIKLSQTLISFLEQLQLLNLFHLHWTCNSLTQHMGFH